MSFADLTKPRNNNSKTIQENEIVTLLKQTHEKCNLFEKQLKKVGTKNANKNLFDEM